MAGHPEPRAKSRKMRENRQGDQGSHHAEPVHSSEDLVIRPHKLIHICG